MTPVILKRKWIQANQRGFRPIMQPLGHEGQCIRQVTYHVGTLGNDAYATRERLRIASVRDTSNLNNILSRRPAPRHLQQLVVPQRRVAPSPDVTGRCCRARERVVPAARAFPRKHD
jgi:hypothetical protein